MDYDFKIVSSKDLSNGIDTKILALQGGGKLESNPKPKRSG